MQIDFNFLFIIGKIEEWDTERKVYLGLYSKQIDIRLIEDSDIQNDFLVGLGDPSIEFVYKKIMTAYLGKNYYDMTKYNEECIN